MRAREKQRPALESLGCWPRQQEHEEVRIERVRRPPAVEVGAGVLLLCDVMTKGGVQNEAQHGSDTQQIGTARQGDD
jgi:hypothetical protein